MRAPEPVPPKALSRPVAGRRPRTRRRKKKRPSLARRLRRWRDRLRRGARAWRVVPPTGRALVLGAVILALLALANVIYQVARKPTEMFVPVAGAFDKAPAETWREYEPLFREYSTASIPPELLAALAQIEGAGNPLAHTYWRWSLTSDPLAIFRPASSAVGMYQMTNPAFSDARRYCIRHHAVVEAKASDGWRACRPDKLYLRTWPSHAVELAAISLDRGVSSVLERVRGKANVRQKRDLAAIVHLCGHRPALAFARRGYRLSPGERCGDHDVAAYLTRVETLTQRFRQLDGGR